MKKYYQKLSKSKRVVVIGSMLPAFAVVGIVLGFILGMSSVNFAPECENYTDEIFCATELITDAGSGDVSFDAVTGSSSECAYAVNEIDECASFEFRGLIGWEARSAFGAWVGMIFSLFAYAGTLIWISVPGKK